LHPKPNNPFQHQHEEKNFVDFSNHRPSSQIKDHNLHINFHLQHQTLIMEVEIRASSNAITPTDDQTPATSTNGHDNIILSTEDTTTIDTLIKHPLQHRWTLWFDNGKKTSQENWANNLRKVLTVDTVEDFWRLYNNITPASKLSTSSTYHFFKENIEPKWEDPCNAKGGKWVVTLHTRARKESLDKLWLWTLLACIGESFEDEEEICGGVISIRKQQDKIALWTRSGDHDEEATKRVGRKLKEVLELTDQHALGYQLHEEARQRDSSFGNANRFKI